MRWLKPLLVASAGAALVAYLVVRPGLAAQNPHLHLYEFPLAVLAVSLLLWGTLRTPKAARPAPPPEWRRHEQVVRPLPDPEQGRLRAPLDAWLADGSRAAEAADVLARAEGDDDPARRDALRERLAREMGEARSARKRAALLRRHARALPTTPSTNAPKTPGA